MNWHHVIYTPGINRLISKCWISVLALFLLATVIPANAETVSPPVLRLPPSAKAPVIDGKMAPGEWDGAFQGCGVLNNIGNVLEVRKARYFLTYDKDRVYIAMQTELPPWGKLEGKRRRVPFEAVSDDELEIYINPCRPAGSQEDSYYQLVGNWAGTMCNFAHDPRVGSMPVNAEMKFENSTADGWWTAEMSVPAYGLHKAAILNGQTWGFNFTRFWHNPFEYSGWPSGSDYFGRTKYFRVTWDNTAPVIQVLGIGDPFGGKPGYDVSLYNPGDAARQLTVTMLVLDRATGKQITEQRQVALAPGKREQVNWQTPFTPSGDDNLLQLEVTSPDGAVQYFKGGLTFKKTIGRAAAWETPPVKETPPIDMQVCLYPSLSRVRALINFSGLKEAATVTKATLAVKDPAGNQIGQGAISRFEEGEGEIVIQLPQKMAEGTYTATLTLQAGDKPTGNPVQKTFIKKNFPFENNTLGISDRVLFPWTPMQADPDKRLVSCWNRDLSIGDNGLFTQVKSGQCDLLARPAQFICRSGGKALALKGDGVKFTKTADNVVDFTAVSTSDKVKVNVDCHSEYDGMFKYTVTMSPQGDGKVDGLDLVVPIKEEYAWLLHGTSDGCRTNNSIFTPQGQGRVWDSLQVAQWRLTGSFIPYLWLGTDREGLCWWADSEKGWVRPANKMEPAIEVRRENGEVQMVLHLIARPYQLTAPRTLVFAFTPTPVRPRPTWARGWANWSSRDDGFLKGPYLQVYGSCAWVSKGKDTLPERPYTYASLRPFTDEADAWLKDYTTKLHETGTQMIVYTDIFSRAVDRGDEMKYYASEWDRYNVAHPQEETQKWTSNRQILATMSKSRIDYDLWCIKHDADLGVDGFYFDEIQASGQLNPTAGFGFQDEDGNWESESCLFALHDYFKRLYTMLDEMGHKEPFIQPHTSSTMYAGPMSFATIPMDLEMSSKDPDPDRGQIFGIGEPYALCNVMAFNHGFAGSGMVCPAPNGQYLIGDSRIARTFLGSMLLFDCHAIFGVTFDEAKLMDHALGRFGYDQPGVEYVPYWRATDLQTVGPDKVHVSLFRNKGMALLVMYNDSPTHTTAKWLPSAKFGCTAGQLTVLDYYGIKGGDFYSYTKDVDGSFQLDIPPYDYRLVQVSTNGTWGAKEEWGPVDPKLFERNVKTVK